MNKPDLIAHLIRLRIIQLLTIKKVLTTQQLLECLVDVPQTSLYRHLKKLLDADIVYIVDKKRHVERLRKRTPCMT